ncbi:MAG: PA domain-containing protein, partial [Chitinophagaceae bacterium]
MKRLVTTLSVVAAVCMLLPSAFAQNQPMSAGLIKPNLSAARFLVNSPSTIGGLKKITIAPWGDQVAVPIINQPVVAGIDSLALLPLTNAAAINGKICLLFRGAGVTFAQKAQYAQNAGAIAVIIVNNVPGPPLGMANTGTTILTIPVVMVSDVDGQAMYSALYASQPVFASIGSWNLGGAHDLAILPGFQATPHAMVIPKSQLSVGANSQPYKNFVAGAIVNYGTSTETNVGVSDSVIWTPTGGSPTTVHTGGYTVSSISPLDSVKFGFGGSTTSYSLPAPTSTGTYTYNYRINYPGPDAVPQDNVYQDVMTVSDSIFCKSNYNFTTNRPVTTLGIQPAGTTTDFSLGPVFYVADGGYAGLKLQYSLSKNGVPTLDGEETYALVYKWVDGSNGSSLDSFIEAPELKLVAYGFKTPLTTADSSGASIMMNLRDVSSPVKKMVLDSNSWYVTLAQGTSNTFVGVDETVSCFTRAYEQSQVFGYQDNPMMLYTDFYTSIATSTNTMITFPFGGNGYYADSTMFDRFYYTPAVAFHISKNKVGVTPPGAVVGIGEPGTFSVYPVPATNFVTVDAKFNATAKVVNYRLLDINGKLVYKLDRTNVSS